MSPRLRRLSGPEVVAIFEELGFQVQSQRGSHIKLRRYTSGGQKQTLTIPRHPMIRPGTLRAIVRQATRFVPEPELRTRFYVD